ncbi:hypothetical protein DENIS_4403 [Desulfonema ishimotonii]|uniref:Uncharacterized protein n=1 Tax=Desulfonema ishimotonii TaxID=45657 RepID=A0A401G2E3_9BACT|nr:hypothetical protein [Desulfonema ishimotonii]GBC63409.1 hypothetical protein DENIS_4403 [Desulfonema ishimotonii]
MSDNNKTERTGPDQPSRENGRVIHISPYRGGEDDAPDLRGTTVIPPAPDVETEPEIPKHLRISPDVLNGPDEEDISEEREDTRIITPNLSPVVVIRDVPPDQHFFEPEPNGSTVMVPDGDLEAVDLEAADLSPSAPVDILSESYDAETALPESFTDGPFGATDADFDAGTVFASGGDLDTPDAGLSGEPAGHSPEFTDTGAAAIEKIAADAGDGLGKISETLLTDAPVLETGAAAILSGEIVSGADPDDRSENTAHSDGPGSETDPLLSLSPPDETIFDTDPADMADLESDLPELDASDILEEGERTAEDALHSVFDVEEMLSVPKPDETIFDMDTADIAELGNNLDAPDLDAIETRGMAMASDGTSGTTAESLADGADEFSDQNTQTLVHTPEDRAFSAYPDKLPDSGETFVDLQTGHITAVPDEDETEEFDIERDDSLKPPAELLVADPTDGAAAAAVISEPETSSPDDFQEDSVIDLNASAIMKKAGETTDMPADAKAIAGPLGEKDELDDSVIDLRAGTVFETTEVPDARPESLAEDGRSADGDEGAADPDAQTVFMPPDETDVLDLDAMTEPLGEKEEPLPDDSVIDLGSGTVFETTEVPDARPEVLAEDERSAAADPDAKTVFMPPDEADVLDLDAMTEPLAEEDDLFPDEGAADPDAQTVFMPPDDTDVPDLDAVTEPLGGKEEPFPDDSVIDLGAGTVFETTEVPDARPEFFAEDGRSADGDEGTADPDAQTVFMPPDDTDVLDLEALAEPLAEDEEVFDLLDAQTIIAPDNDVPDLTPVAGEDRILAPLEEPESEAGAFEPAEKLPDGSADRLTDLLIDEQTEKIDLDAEPEPFSAATGDGPPVMSEEEFPAAVWPEENGFPEQENSITPIDLLRDLDALPDTGDFPEDETVGFLDVLQAAVKADSEEYDDLSDMFDMGMISRLRPESADITDSISSGGRETAEPPGSADGPGEIAGETEETLPETEEFPKAPVMTEPAESRVSPGRVAAEPAEPHYFSVSPEQMEAALGRVVEKIFSERIEAVMTRVIEKAVSDEMKKIRQFLIADTADGDPL